MLVFAFHGASYLSLRTTGDLFERAKRAARTLAVPALVVGAGYLIWTVAAAMDRNDKDLFPPVLPAALAIAAFLLATLYAYAGRGAPAFSAFGTFALVATIFTSLYPRVMVSDPTFANSLTIDNSSSAHYTLAVLTVVAAICVPLVLLYQGWTYYVFRARVTGEEVRSPAELLEASALAGDADEPSSPPAAT